VTGRTAAWVGLGAAVPVLGLVVNLFENVMRPAREIDRYAKDILEAGLAISANLEGVSQLDHTRDLGAAVPGLAVAYLKRLGAID
jgi:hypothetical protein